MNLGLRGKTVIVTGGASGLGAAIGAAFQQEGANLVIFDLAGPTELAKDSLSVVGDITKAEDIERALITAHKNFGAIDILVNNAGTWPSTKVPDMADEEWERVLSVNLTGAFLFCKRFLRYLAAETRRGQIINIVSPVAFQGSGNGHSHYAAAKAGLVSFTQSLALEVARRGIRVVAVAPGIMRTDMTRAALDAAPESYLNRIPIGRFVGPTEVANIVVFVASDMASCITGATIDATGGMLMH
jgi:3-oxoacyl-[acyl-carrier protein] reductase